MQYQVGDVIQFMSMGHPVWTKIERIENGFGETMLWGYWTDHKTGIRDTGMSWMPPDRVTLVRRRGCVMR